MPCSRHATTPVMQANAKAAAPAPIAYALSLRLNNWFLHGSFRIRFLRCP
ncbi:hypothetical protein BIFGAL_03504 [Bifidobacterium gallicum DSM 20093 = LMG 11596]|uniref:Uncharacterized protein n=1 Tax=Bifidobacterium gallicum DSM 20093 = LMG 11596 TaxID=561180 RepID=D1NUI1_9BIFI|nr:hypothetical protein BIFGAL_03504 [Bifidobacterium gallicum DSM 20093 = LMG 11596]